MISAQSSFTAWDWVSPLTSLEKRENCGIVTQIVCYSNGHFEPMPFFCHSWSCPFCANMRRLEYADKIIKVSPIWYVICVPECQYTAVQKRITRAGTGYCAMQREDHWVILTLDPVIEGSQLIACSEPGFLAMQCCIGPHEPGERMFRSSRGLFPGKKDSDVHITFKVLVREGFPVVLKKLKDDGHIFNSNKQGRLFSTPTGDFEAFLEGKKPDYFEVIGAEQPARERINGCPN